MYIIRSDEEDRAGLPLGLPLVLHDRQFYADGSLNFPTLGVLPDLHPQWCPEYYGDTILVNGVAWPHAKVFPRAYRFRILNGCSARFFVLALSDPAVGFSQIGTDGGFVGDGPWNLSSITMAPAERVDVIVDFSALRPGDKLVLNNSGPTPFPSGDKPEVGGPPGTTAVMEFVVVDDSDEDGIADGIVDEAHLPIDLGSLVDRDEAPLREENVAVTRSLSVVEYDDADHMPMQFTLENRTWADPVAVTPAEGETELWELMNLKTNAHPLHVHLTSFRVLNQQAFSNVTYEAAECSLGKAYLEPGSCFTEAPGEPTDWQKGWKDTVILWPSVVTRVLVRFSARNGSAFGFDPTQGPGYLWHCHIVDHEDNVMMRPFKIVRNSTAAALVSGGGTAAMRRMLRD
jgi:FtsP/CotA-like multicopper oxidase with cupredoxin domain